MKLFEILEDISEISETEVFEDYLHPDLLWGT
jgi:hypothetical protein